PATQQVYSSCEDTSLKCCCSLGSTVRRRSQVKAACSMAARALVGSGEVIGSSACSRDLMAASSAAVVAASVSAISVARAEESMSLSARAAEMRCSNVALMTGPSKNFPFANRIPNRLHPSLAAHLGGSHCRCHCRCLHLRPCCLAKPQSDRDLDLHRLFLSRYRTRRNEDAERHSSARSHLHNDGRGGEMLHRMLRYRM